MKSSAPSRSRTALGDANQRAATELEKTSPQAVAASLAKVAEIKRKRFGDKPKAVEARPPAPQPRTQAERPQRTDLALRPEAAAPAKKPVEAAWERGVLGKNALVLQGSALARVVEGAFRDLFQAEPIPSARDGANHEALGQRFELALAHELRRGGRVLAFAGVFLFAWAALVPISGAVIVAGSLVLQSSIKKVQHPAGGIVSAISVRNGSKVKAGDELARLDQTAARTNLQVIARQLDEVRLRIARLATERDGLTEPNWPNERAAEVTAAERNRLLVSERNFFEARASARKGQQQLSESRVLQLEREIAGLEAQLASNGRQSSITSSELKNVESLLHEKLVTIQRATTLQREAARLDGVDGQLASQIAETRNKINETRLQAIQSEQSFRSEVMRDLSEAEAKEGELIERRTAAEDQLNRTVIRAPSSGTIQEVGIHTVGGVVGAGEVLMAVVPEGDTLEIAARLSPDKIDQVHAGQAARVRLSAFNARTTPELTGAVDTISADIVRDSQPGPGYYDVRIALPAEQILRLRELQLIPGMPAEVFLETGSRTMLSYLFKPITDQLSRMFRER